MIPYEENEQKRLKSNSYTAVHQNHSLMLSSLNRQEQ